MQNFVLRTSPLLVSFSASQGCFICVFWLAESTAGKSAGFPKSKKIKSPKLHVRGTFFFFFILLVLQISFLRSNIMFSQLLSPVWVLLASETLQHAVTCGPQVNLCSSWSSGTI